MGPEGPARLLRRPRGRVRRPWQANAPNVLGQSRVAKYDARAGVLLAHAAEFEEAKRRLRLCLTKDGRLNIALMRTLDPAADHSVLFPLVDVLLGYDGNRSRYDEIDAAIISSPLPPPLTQNGQNVPWSKSATLGRTSSARGTRCSTGPITPSWVWAATRVVRWMRSTPAPASRARAVGEALLGERFAARTADVPVAVAKLDEECASHLYCWSVARHAGRGR